MGNTSIFDLFRSDKDKAKKTNLVRTQFYRGHVLKRNMTNLDIWSVTISDKPFTGKLEFVKMSVDEWCENGVVVAPEHFEQRAEKGTEHQTEEYQGYKIINDLGGDNDWYVMYRGKLIKGSKNKIEEFIDKMEEKIRARNEMESNK